jgi:hypothetical protein
MVAAAGSVLLLAQAPADDITQLERQRADAIRDGQNAVRFYSPAYRGISALGQYETREQAIEADARQPRTRDVSVERHGDAAIVTGIETPGGAGDRERVLRIWTRGNDIWTIVSAQTTWIGARTGVAAPSGPLPDAVEPFCLARQKETDASGSRRTR